MTINAMQEVHRWRGTPEQRAKLAGARKLGQFAYFDAILGHPGWRRRRVLDFGGSDGNLLRNEDCAIAPRDYWCLDVVKDAILAGSRAFPDAHWAHYDRYHCSFNPTGVPDLAVPDLGVAFDFILAYSVFTHTTLDEMRELVPQLRAQLAPDGVLAFTFQDPHYEPWTPTRPGSNLRLRLETFRTRDFEQLAATADGTAWCALVDGTSLFVNDSGRWSGEAERCMTYDVYFTTAFMQAEFPDAEIVAPVNAEMQHCCVLRGVR